MRPDVTGGNVLGQLRPGTSSVAAQARLLTLARVIRAGTPLSDDLAGTV